MSGIIRDLFKITSPENEDPPPYWKRGIGLLLVMIFTTLVAIRRMLAMLLRYITRRRLGAHSESTVVAFFHPYCNNAGGGERVLWRAIDALLASGRRVHIVIYTCDTDKSPQELLGKARRIFQLELKRGDEISFVSIASYYLLEPSMYPVATVLGQSLGSMLVACECLVRATPDIFFDSTGFAFTMGIAKLLCACYTAAYVHYPTISTDMLQKVVAGTASYNHAQWITKSGVASFLKALYYRALAAAYGFCGQHTDVVMVNSTWTLNHIKALWCTKKRAVTPRVVFPPCGTCKLMARREDIVLSIGQFRPEKNHYLQLEALALAINKCESLSNVKLSIIGGTDDKQHLLRVEDLRQHAKILGIANNVEFVVDCDFEELCKRLRSASVGIHTMKEEHFGIAVVEMMTAGLITVAHRSGGPLMDIISERETGFLAESAEEYADILIDVLGSKKGKWSELRARGRESTLRFSDSSFDIAFITAMQPLLVKATIGPSKGE